MNGSDWTAGDENVARLLGRAYDPPPVPVEFAQRVQARLLEVAAEESRRRAAVSRGRATLQRRLTALAGVAALLGIVALGLRLLPSARRDTPEAQHPPHSVAEPMTAASAPTAGRVSVLATGQTLVTRDGERRRVALPDGSVLSLNQNTTVHCDAPRQLALKAGEIFVEVAAHLTAPAAPLFTVSTPHRAIRAVGTKFLVRADAAGTGVAVTQGQVHVSDRDDLLGAGQQLAPKGSVTPMPRMSHLLDWTRDLVASAAPPLVPPSAYAGGALVAADSQGHFAPLTLRKYHIDVHIEDGFARTTIDQTYFNHTLNRLEGTFFFPLPADASLSRLAMYVNGELMEGGMAEREYARTVFEQIVTKMKDPALLEWVDGRTFKMRVFPLEPRQEKRIILSYTQRLPNLYGRLSYRFPAGHSLGTVRDWSFHARVKNGAASDWHCDSRTLTPRVEGTDLLLDAGTHQAAMDRDIVLELSEQPGAAAARFSTAEQDGYRYLMLRYRPDLPGKARRHRRDWVFLFESSADRDPLLARTQIEVIRTLLANAEHDDTFAVLTADTQVRKFTPVPLSATPENIAAALAFLERAHLLGALDLDAGLTAAAEMLRGSRDPVLVHLGSAQAVLGERRADVLANRIPAGACYVGVGIGKRWAQDFMQRAAERCQGYVTQINPDESVTWRTFDLFATLNTPRLLHVQVADPAGKAQFLCPQSILAQGEELCAIARLPAGAPLPMSIRVTGTLDGGAFQSELTVESPRPGAAYLPRTWARLEIDRLLSEDVTKNKGTIIALSKAMYVMTPYTSLLVLENEAMYAQFKVDRGRKDHWAMYSCPQKIPVVYEPPPQDWRFTFDPVTGLPLNLGEDPAAGLNVENNQLRFYPPSHALTVKATAFIHNRVSNPIASSVPIADGTSNTIFITEGAQKVLVTNGSVRLINPPKDWNLQFNPITGQSLNPLGNSVRPPMFKLIQTASVHYQLTIPQAQLIRQGDIRSALQTRPPAIGEYEYERTHWPDSEKVHQDGIRRELDHARFSPPLADILSGRSLNVLLHYFIARQKQGVRGPNIPLSQDTLKSINLSTSDNRGNIGLLKKNSILQWPQPLMREPFKDARARLQANIQRADQAVRANLHPEDAILAALQADLTRLNAVLDDHLSEISPDEYIEAKRYLRLLGDTVMALKDPNVTNYFNGTWKAKGQDVASLVQFMGATKLYFAPAMPGDERAYLSLHRALVAFDAGMPHPAAPLRPAQRDDNASPALASSDPEGAERLLAALLADPLLAKRSSLWRQGAQIAEHRRQYDTAMRRLERALELEAKQPQTLVSLRRDYGLLLHLAQEYAKEQASLRRAVPRAWLDRVMSIADCWRAADPMDWVPCWLAGNILRLVGERELAWGYLTTPSMLHDGSAAGWLELARQQHWQGEYDLAERAFAVASSLDPSNAEIISERALNHRAAGRDEAARKLVDQIETDW